MKKTKSTTNSVKWNAINSLVSQTTTIITGVVLMRLLDPSTFGLIGMITVFTGFLNVLKNSGLTASLIYHSELKSVDLDTIFWFNNLMGLVICTGFFFSSDLISGYYNEAILSDLVKVFSFTFIFSALSKIHFTLLRKQLDFKRIFLVEITGTIVSVVLALISAFMGLGVWSLIIMHLSKNIINTINIYLVSTYKPSFQYSHSILKKHMQYSFPVLGTKTFNYWTRNADNFFIGSMLGSVALGFYSRAFFFVTMPTQQISSIIGNILFPSLSLFKSDKKRAVELYLKSMRMTALITFPLLGGLMMITEPFVVVAFGSQWLPIITTLKIMCILSALQSVFVFTTSIFFSQGATKLNFNISIIYGICNITAFYIGSLYSIEMVAMLLLLVYLIFLGPKLYFGSRLIDLKVSTVFSNIAVIFVINLVCMFLTYCAIFFLDSKFSHTLILVIGVIFYSISFLFLNFVFNKTKLMEFTAYLLRALRE